MLELLTGAGLALAAGLNAWIPLVLLGALDRFTGLVDLPATWAWLSNEWVLLILVVLLVAEVVADKMPGFDHVNDVIQTFVRPTAGGLAFGSGATATTVAVTDPAEFFTSNQWVPIAVGAAVALAMHLLKAAARPLVNAATLGLGAPIVSAAEDVSAIALSFAAVVVPILVVVGIIVIVVVAIRVIRRRRLRRGERNAASEGPGAEPVG